MFVKVLSLDGNVSVIPVPLKSSFEDIKLAAVCRLLKPALQSEHSMYRLISVRLSVPFEDKVPVSSVALKNGDELILAKVKDVSNEKMDDEESLNVGSDSADEGGDTVDLETIHQATAHIPVRPKVQATELHSDMRSLSDLHPVFVNLVSSAQKVLCLSKDAEKIFRHVQEQLSNPYVHLPQYADECSVKQLVDMGFPRERACKALRLNHNILSSAMDWLFANEGDPRVDEPLDIMKRNKASNSNDLNNTDGLVEPMSPMQILKLFRAYNRSQFRPNESVKHELMEMGFEEAGVTDALRLASNDQGGALDLLLSHRGVPVEEDVELVGISEESPLWKAICSDFVIQFGLTNPNTLFVLLDILDNPATAMRWMNNPEVGPFLYHVSRLYNSESPEAPAVNQMEGCSS